MNRLTDQKPLISIGVPTYNRAASLERVLESLVSQSYTNLEIIISDNCSPDAAVQDVAEKFAQSDSRVQYFRQTENLGAAFNFKFVLDQASGKYFMWNADDDLRSDDFIEVNSRFLEKNKEYPASTSPNALVKDFSDYDGPYVDFSLEGNLYQRFRKFFENALRSHGILYSLFRTDVIKKNPYMGKDFIAADWAIDLFVLSHGPIARQKEGRIMSSIGGVSQSGNHFKNYRKSVVDDFFPMYQFTKEIKHLLKPLSIREKLKIRSMIFKFNHIYYNEIMSKAVNRLRSMT
tara:strand:+ start:4842 stop:5711 length:870 start_codon:yes stop_codon:yes gene_type:complete